MAVCTGPSFWVESAHDRDAFDTPCAPRPLIRIHFRVSRPTVVRVLYRWFEANR